MRIHPLFHCAEPLTHPVHTVHYTQCRKQLLTILFIFVVLFVLHQWSTTLNNVFDFSFYSPQGFSSTASEDFTSLDNLSFPTSLWGQCHFPVTDRKQTGTGSKWVTQSHAAFCHLGGDGNSASSKRSLPLSHYSFLQLEQRTNQNEAQQTPPEVSVPWLKVRGIFWAATWASLQSSHSLTLKCGGTVLCAFCSWMYKLTEPTEVWTPIAVGALQAAVWGWAGLQRGHRTHQLADFTFEVLNTVQFPLAAALSCNPVLAAPADIVDELELLWG